MLVPSKVCNFKNSTLSKLPIILEKISTKSISLNELYLEVGKKFDDISEFLLAIDSLYILDSIEVLEGGEVRYVSGN